VRGSGNHIGNSLLAGLRQVQQQLREIVLQVNVCRLQVLVKLARIAGVRPPRGLPTNRQFFRLSTTRFISRSLTLLSMSTTAPSEQNTFCSAH
jgi:hypothetical protein